MPFPTSVPIYVDTTGAEFLGTAGGGAGLSAILDLYGIDIMALATKMGTGSSTPGSGKVLRSTGAGVSSWGAVDITTDITGAAAGVVTFLGAPSSANLRSAVTDETGTGSLVFATSPVIVTPTIASFVNATHDHAAAAGGGTLGAGAVPNLAYNTQALSNPYKFKTNAAANQTGVASNTWTQVTLGTEVFDTNNNFASNTYTAPVAGFYQFNAGVAGGSSVAGAIQGSPGIRLVKNGATVVSELNSPFDNGVSYDNTASALSDMVQLAQGDTIVLHSKFTVSSGTVTFSSGVGTFLNGFLVSHT